jgi:hypothetical protein
VNRKCVVVMGPFRSGTSLLSRVVMCLGYSAGPEKELFEPTDWNPAGYIQRPDVTAFNSQLIKNAGGTIANPPHPEEIKGYTPYAKVPDIDFGWANQERSFLIKDPRFCVTLHYWIEKKLFGKVDLAIIRIKRDINDVVRSCLLHYDVKEYLGRSEQQAHHSIALYEKYADWHIRNIKAAKIEIAYEELVFQPADTVKLLSRHLQCDNEEQIDMAIAALNTGRSRINPDESP